MAKFKEGDVLTCKVCGLVVIVDEACGCAAGEILCCNEKPMVKKAAAGKAKKKSAVKAAAKPAKAKTSAPVKATKKAPKAKKAPAKKPAAKAKK